MTIELIISIKIKKEKPIVANLFYITYNTRAYDVKAGRYSAGIGIW